MAGWYILYRHPSRKSFLAERDALRVYGLDRVKDLEVTDRTFVMPKDFDVNELFATSFGIYLPEGKGKTVRFRAGVAEAEYIRDLPLHASQVEEKSDGEFVTFNIFVCPDRNLVMEFCKYGSRIEVLSPQEVRDAVAAEFAKASRLYE